MDPSRWYEWSTVAMDIELNGRMTVYAPAFDGEVHPGDVELLFRQVVAYDQYHTGGNIHPGDVAIDVGASVGAWTWMVGDAGGAVISIEPNPREFSSLSSLISHHGIVSIPERVAVIDRVGMAAFSPGNLSSCGHGQLLTDGNPVRFMCRERSEAESIQVPTTTIDLLVDGHGLDRVDVIKIDTEGEEGRVLVGASGTISRFRPVILMSEYHRPGDPVALPNMVRSFADGYREFHVRRDSPVCEPITVMVPEGRSWDLT